jgi:hypothetical protein
VDILRRQPRIAVQQGFNRDAFGELAKHQLNGDSGPADNGLAEHDVGPHLDALVNVRRLTSIIIVPRRAPDVYRTGAFRQRRVRRFVRRTLNEEPASGLVLHGYGLD